MTYDEPKPAELLDAKHDDDPDPTGLLTDYEPEPDTAAQDARDINDMLNEMRDLYHDAFGKYSTDVAGFLRVWSQHENAPRTTCAECHFESNEGYPPSHAPGCSRKADHD